MIQNTSIDQIRSNPYHTDVYLESDIQALAEGIKKNGLQSPIKVRKMGDGYQVVHGEKRFQAFRRMGEKSVIVRVVDVDDLDGVLVSLRDNISEGTSNSYEQALVFQLLRDKFGLNDKEIGDRVGLGRSVVANRRRLSGCGVFLKACLVSGCLSESHVRELLRVPGQYLVYPVGDLAIDWGLSVRELRRIVDSVINGESVFWWDREIELDKIFMSEGSPPKTCDPSVVFDMICICVSGELIAGQAEYLISKLNGVESVPVRIIYFVDWLKPGSGDVLSCISVSGVQPVRADAQKSGSGRLLEALIKFSGGLEEAQQSFPVGVVTRMR